MSLAEIFSITITHPKVALRKLLQKGFSISSYRLSLGLARHCHSLNTIFDVGANQGQFALSVRREFPNAKIYAFEPIPEIAASLRKNVSAFPQINVFDVALGKSNGTMEFYKNDYSLASSALPISSLQVELIPRTRRARLIKVRVERLDEVADRLETVPPTLLKMDVQGYEKEVLLGGRKFLRRVDFLLFETSFVRMYDGEPLFEEMHSLVKRLGFSIVGPLGILESNDGKILQMDMLYCNKRLRR